MAGLSGTRCEYVPVRLTAASMLQTVPERPAIPCLPNIRCSWSLIALPRGSGWRPVLLPETVRSKDAALKPTWMYLRRVSGSSTGLHHTPLTEVWHKTGKLADYL